jgi:ComF family protein
MILSSPKSNLSGIRQSVSDFISLFFPDYCLGCSRALVKGEEILCTFCIHELPTTDYQFSWENPLIRKFSGRINLKYALAYLKFRKTGIVQHLMHQLKYNNHPEVGIKLGKIFGKELKDAGLQGEFDVIVPVPLHKAKLIKRGYNQSAKFAEGLSCTLAIPVLENISVKTIQTETQTKKNRRERWENVRHSFAIRSPESINRKRILLVDDVVTTGATLEACGQELLSKGCSELSIACIAEAQ